MHTRLQEVAGLPILIFAYVCFGSKADMSAIHPKADMVHQSSDVRFVPKADIGTACR
jgi:hypothetical protein